MVLPKRRGTRTTDTNTMATRVLLTTLALALMARAASGMMDITAFEYIRKFSDPLDLGECPRREVPISNGKGSHGMERLRCSRRKFGNVTSLTRPVHSKRNAPISTPNDIIAYLGLCGGEAASFLGILNNGDCVAIEIASKLTFNEKTMIRAYVEYYRKSLDILENNIWPSNDIESKNDGKYYLKNISYGTLEIIIVQFRFRTRKETMKAKEIRSPKSLMSVYMETVRREVGTLANLLIIRLSTAGKGQYSSKTFKSGQYAHALRYVQIMEGEIKHLRDDIDHDKVAPHLRYSLYPFETQQKAQSRLAHRQSLEMWEKTSVLEVTLRQSTKIGKKATKRCRKVHSQLCKRVRELLRTLKRTQRVVHRSRSRWMELKEPEKEKAAKSSTDVNRYSNAMKRLARLVRKWWKTEKFERLKRRKQRKNQTGVEGRNRMLPPKLSKN
ncbi:uncharacterized protein [Haliotis cracherodii]|uniref:uncharacterized protein n=1 Tax=Haliotis cracherodii TaxID=6455 RepID=UPI0039E879A4